MFALVVTKELAQYANAHWGMEQEGILFLCEKVEEQDIDIDWAKQYPFEEAEGQSEQKNTVASNSNIKNAEDSFVQALQKKMNAYLNQYKNKVAKAKSSIDNACTEDLFRYQYFSEAAVRIEQFVKWDIYQNEKRSTVDIGEGYLIKLVKEKDATASANNVIEFKQYLDTLGIDFFYVQAPYKLSPYEDNSIGGIYKDYANDNANQLVGLLQQADVDVLDLREVIQTENLNHRELFFKTDHHWKPDCGQQRKLQNI